MEIQKKLKELIAAEDSQISKLQLQLRATRARVEGFKISLSAVNGSADTQKDFTSKVQSQIDRETTAADNIEFKLTDSRARKTAFEQSLNILSPNSVTSKQGELRASSELAKIRDLIRTAQKPLTLDEILVLLGKPEDKAKFRSLRGTIRAYAKKGNIFTIVSESPHTFGLVEFIKKTNEA